MKDASWRSNHNRGVLGGATNQGIMESIIGSLSERHPGHLSEAASAFTACLPAYHTICDAILQWKNCIYEKLPRCFDGTGCASPRSNEDLPHVVANCGVHHLSVKEAASILQDLVISKGAEPSLSLLLRIIMSSNTCGGETCSFLCNIKIIDIILGD